MKNLAKSFFTFLLIVTSFLAFSQKSFTKVNVNIPAGREILMQPLLNRIGHANGTVTIDLVMNKRGDVIAAVANKRTTTVKNKAFVRKVEDAVLAMKFNKMQSAPREQAGSLSYSFR